MARPTIAAARISLIALSAAMTLPAVAAEKSWSLSGSTLAISTPCAKQVEIVPSSRSAEISVSAVAEHPEEIDALSVSSSGNGVSVTKQGNRCPLSQSRKRETLRLTITLPSGSDLSVREGGSGEYRITVPVNRLDLRLSGSGGLSAEQVAGRLDASLSGSGGGQVARMEGGDAIIRASGSGGMLVGGRIGNLQVDLSGSGGVEVGAAGAAILETSGSGGIRTQSVNGPLSFEATGSGGLKLGMISADNVKIRTSGDGGVSIRDGRVGSLQVSATGSADARLDIVADRAELSTSGSGDIQVRQVTGNVSQRHSGSGKVRVGG